MRLLVSVCRRGAAAKKAGHDIQRAFALGRIDATQEQSDVELFEVLESVDYGFHNYLPSAALLIEKAQLLKLLSPSQASSSCQKSTHLDT